VVALVVGVFGREPDPTEYPGPDDLARGGHHQ
jgi:hypothetical protein